MICEELEKEITSETCAAMKKHNWCDRTCEEPKIEVPKNGNGGSILKSPQNNPIAIAQDSQISTITPKLAQSTEEPTKTIQGHSTKQKQNIMGKCEKTGDELTWGGCRQRKTKSNIEACKDCDQKAFRFYEKPMGRGWANSAARAIEVDCPDLGRKVKLPSCKMKQGRLVKAGKTCDVTCQYWEGGKPVVILCQKCSDVEVKRIGELCLGCEAEEKKTKTRYCTICKGEFLGVGEICQVCMRREKREKERTLIAVWCPKCQEERLGQIGDHCGACQSELQEKKSVPDPMIYFCPTPDCDNQVKVEGMLCGDCQIEGFKKVENQKNPNHVKLVGISSHMLGLLAKYEKLLAEIEGLEAIAALQRNEIVAELQKAIKEDRS